MLPEKFFANFVHWAHRLYVYKYCMGEHLRAYIEVQNYI